MKWEEILLLLEETNDITSLHIYCICSHIKAVKLYFVFITCFQNKICIRHLEAFFHEKVDTA